MRRIEGAVFRLTLETLSTLTNGTEETLVVNKAYMPKHVSDIAKTTDLMKFILELFAGKGLACFF